MHPTGYRQQSPKQPTHTPIKNRPILSTGYRQQSPKQPTHTDKQHTEHIPQATDDYTASRKGGDSKTKPDDDTSYRNIPQLLPVLPPGLYTG